MNEPTTTLSQTKLQRATWAVWLAVGVLVLGYAAFRLLVRPLAVVLAPLLLALLIVYLLNPLVTGLERRGMPRWLGTGIAYLGFIGTLSLLAVLVIPLLATQVANFAEFAPELGSRLVEGVNRVLSTLGLSARLDTSLSGDALAEQVQGFLSAEENRSTVLALLGGISGLAMGIVHLLVVVIAGPFIALYTLVDLHRMKRGAYQLVPPVYRAEVAIVASRLGQVVGGFVRGQLIVATFVGVATSLGLWLIGLPFWLLVGLIGGVTNLVPLIGPFVGGLIGVTIALVAEGPGLALLVILVVTIVQQVDGHLVSPLVVGRTVRLHPLMVLLALLVSGMLYGIFGMLVAVPLVAGAKVLTSHVWQTRVPWAEAAGAEGPALATEAEATAPAAEAEAGLAQPSARYDGALPGTAVLVTPEEQEARS